MQQLCSIKSHCDGSLLQSLGIIILVLIHHDAHPDQKQRGGAQQPLWGL